MANPHPTEPKNRRVDELADLLHDASNDLMDWNYSNHNQSLLPFIETAEQIVGWAEELRAEVRRWSATGRPSK